MQDESKGWLRVLKHAAIELIRIIGVYQYFNPDSGKTRGTGNFACSPTLPLFILL